MGTGTSGAVPNVTCLTSIDYTCKVCKLSMTPEGSKNKRRNTSLLVCIDHPDGRQRNILIDCGKSFYDSALDVFIKNEIRTIDAVMLTHGHADAVLGLDDLRQWTVLQNRSIPIYCDQSTLETVSGAFPYLVDMKKATNGGGVASLDFRIIEEFSRPFVCEGVAFQPLHVEHGTYGDGRIFYFNGFRFDNVSYISDCSKIPDTTRPLINGTKLLILDALRPRMHVSHFGYNQAIDEIRRFKPDRALLTGFCHDIEHSEMEQLAKQLMASEGLVADPAYDGLRIEL
ncbi:metallo-beta-lactamase family protein [Coemansia reversa NRRL 1564]|uniref:Metallo-beta-lactamase family protein n=1 Tax=Coemansia reversa (strain ATCC 12441 / NRRL 1564) TaxID=763665 RepID=A0A2G5BH86_COERN|nr:metallo-beta-lactamase family protein [Coemansia reversa NRRL 1564]|eukprot:PIA18373.1 metallo-beta-lactamase family protein [Coemansia reversa NRRL 1564]